MLLKDILKYTKYKKTIGDKNYDIKSLGLCNRKYSFPILSYITSDKFMENVLNNNDIKAIIISSDLSQYSKLEITNHNITIIETTENPEICFYNLHKQLISNTNFYNDYNFKSIIGKNTKISPTAIIKKGVIIGDNVEIGHQTIIYSGTKIGNNTKIGDFCSIGAEGFQIIKSDDGIPFSVKHVGGVSIGESCFICNQINICKNIFNDCNRIDDNVMIDSLSQIAHNCYINKSSVLTAGTILCGSVNIKSGSWIGTNSTILNKTVIAKNTIIGIGSTVTKNTEANSTIYGPAANKKNH